MHAVQLIQEGCVIEVRHIFREENRCDDFLANWAQERPLGVTVLEHPPSEMLQLLYDDIFALPAVRL